MTAGHKISQLGKPWAYFHESEASYRTFCCRWVTVTEVLNEYPCAILRGTNCFFEQRLWRITESTLYDEYNCYQYNEINVMHVSFSLLRIKILYMFRKLLAHPQEALHKRHLVYCVRGMSVGCGSFTAVVAQPSNITRTQYTKCRLCSASWEWASNARNM
jgi:hypothetical protein